MCGQWPVRQIAKDDAGPTLDDKVAYLSRPESYWPVPTEVSRRETHMSWVFLAGDRVYKLKKPVRFHYLDFSSLSRREQACRAELKLNRRLAPDVYLDVVALLDTGSGLAMQGDGTPVDWLVCMQRLDERFTLERLIVDQRLQISHIDRLAGSLTDFYRNAVPVFLAPAVYLAEMRRSLDYNRQVLLNPRFVIPVGLFRHIDQVQRHFLDRCGGLITARLQHRRVVDGHGDLRPEHIWLDDKVRIIDCLEFNPRLRVVDPFDEIAYLSLECERLGADWVGAYLRRRMKRVLRDGPVEALFAFYHCYRATLRARLAIAHLLEAHPRTPDKWPRLAVDYLALAERSARKIEAWLRTRRGRSGCAPHAGAGRPPRGEGPMAI